jgi:hypothetical protein
MGYVRILCLLHRVHSTYYDEKNITYSKPKKKKRGRGAVKMYFTCLVGRDVPRSVPAVLKTH